MSHWMVVSFLLLADVGLGESLRIVSLPAQHLACVSGESPSETSILEDGLRTLHTELIGADVEHTGYPFFLELNPIVPDSQEETLEPGVAEEESLPLTTRIAWKFCVPVGARVLGAGELEIVETSQSKVVILSVGDFERNCAEELEDLVAAQIGRERENPPRSIPIFQMVGAPVDLPAIAPFLATDSLETLELTALEVVAEEEAIDKQLAGENQQIRPLFVLESPRPQPEQAGVTCLLVLTAEEAETLSAG
ncbi:MAG: hypothetical protein AAGC60_24625 [Acidobacteriota bacterium]